jgi:hypothetical protein
VFDELCQRVGVVYVNAACQREPRDRAIHRARVEEAIAELGGDRRTDGALSRSRRTVDRDDDRAGR